MLRHNCENVIKALTQHRRCGFQFRSRVPHKMCRSCYKEITGEPRPLNRVKSNKTKVVKTKPVVVPTKRKK